MLDSDERKKTLELMRTPVILRASLQSEESSFLYTVGINFFVC